MNSSRSTNIRSGFVLACMLLPVLLIAQYQVNTQVYRGGAPSTGSIRYGSTIQTQSVALPSQARYEAWSAGATPSSIRMEYNRVGPLAPSGATAYIPPAPNYYAPKTSTAGNFVDTRVTGPTVVSAPPAAAPGWQSFNTGSVKYAPATPQQQLAVTPWASFQSTPMGGSSLNQSLGASSFGSVKYSN